MVFRETFAIPSFQFGSPTPFQMGTRSECSHIIHAIEGAGPVSVPVFRDLAALFCSCGPRSSSAHRTVQEILSILIISSSSRVLALSTPACHQSRSMAGSTSFSSQSHLPRDFAYHLCIHPLSECIMGKMKRSWYLPKMAKRCI